MKILDTMKFIMDDKMMEYLIDLLYEFQKQESPLIPTLKKQLADVETGIQNMLNALQMGIITASTQQRMLELEERKHDLEVSIIQEELKHPILTREQIAFFIYRFRKIDRTKKEQRQSLIDSFVNAVYLYDDKVILTFNYREGGKTITLKEIEGSDLLSSSAVWRKRPSTNRRWSFCVLGGQQYLRMPRLFAVSKNICLCLRDCSVRDILMEQLHYFSF